MKSKREMIVEGLLRNIRSTLFNKKNAGLTSSVFYVEPEYQQQIIGLLEEDNYQVTPVALYELKVKWEKEEKDKKNEPK